MLRHKQSLIFHDVTINIALLQWFFMLHRSSVRFISDVLHPFLDLSHPATLL